MVPHPLLPAGAGVGAGAEFPHKGHAILHDAVAVEAITFSCSRRIFTKEEENVENKTRAIFNWPRAITKIVTTLSVVVLCSYVALTTVEKKEDAECYFSDASHSHDFK